jgi:mono/diheme cytochrome c family protein
VEVIEMSRPHAVGAAVLALAAALCWTARPLATPDAEVQVPQRLSETGLFAAGRPGVVDPSNVAFVPQYPLWTDGAAKRRWVHLPAGTTIDVSAGEGAWDFPVGTRFWKEFSFGGRRVETRMLWKALPNRWIAASYVWNDDQTDATLAPDAGLAGVADVGRGRKHGIPSRQDCLACHGAERTAPLGFNALQLSTDRDPNAIHAEPAIPGMVTIETLLRDGRLSPARSDWISSPPRIRTSDPATRTMLGYLAANCAHCHNGNGEIAALGPTLRLPDLLRDGDAVARDLVDRGTSWQVPGVADGASVLVSSHAPSESAILVRMKSRRPSSQMPPLGTVLPDEQAVQAVETWIAQQASTREPVTATAAARTRVPDVRR